MNPSKASPVAKVTACCSHIPTSKNLSGYFSEKSFKPVPSLIAAVIAIIRGSISANLRIVFPKISV